MADKYAPEAPVKDLRIHATEMKIVDPSVKETATEYQSANVDIALKSGSDFSYVDNGEQFKKPEEGDLQKIEDASRTIKDDETKDNDVRAAAAIQCLFIR